MISICSQGKPFNITVIQAYVPTTNDKRVNVEQFLDDLQDFVEQTPKKDAISSQVTGMQKVGSQEI